MKIGIVGFPGSGKTTIFNALTGSHAATGPGGGAGGAKAKENLGVIKVPDERIDKLAEIHASKKRVYAEIGFVDVAAKPQAGGSKGGLDAQTLGAMRECDTLVLVTSAFANPGLSDPPDPKRDLTNFLAELILGDLQPLESRRERMKKEGGKDHEKALVAQCIEHLEQEKPLSQLTFSADDFRTLAGFGLLTLKPLLCLLNQEEGDFPNGIPADVQKLAKDGGLDLLGISGKVEMDISTLPPAEQPEFLAALGIKASARDRFVQAAYAKLDLISFITTGPDESRAWPIKRGISAQKAAGKIHSDIERGFIRAEVISYAELVNLGSEKKAREAGKLKLEGKEYIVQDGDVIEFRFAV